MKLLVQFSRIFVGILFIISGLIKLNDPVGTQYKMEEYFEVLHIPIFIPLALYISWGMCVLEVVLGVALLMWYRIRFTLWALLSLIVFFTFLTFYSAYFNKVTDCGCFGDALKLTPWTSFSKDVVLLLLTLIILFGQKHIGTSKQTIRLDLLMILVLISQIGIGYWCIEHLSFIDFRAYKVGNSIPQLMQTSCPPKYAYIMTKENVEYTFDTFPTDTSYVYKDMKLINPECMPKITDYAIWNEKGDYTKASFEGNKLIILILNVQKSNKNSLEAIKKLCADAAIVGIEPVIFTASDKNSFEVFKAQYGLDIPYYFADGVVIKTIIRSNPGIMYLKDGVVKGKWHYNDVPDIKTLQSI